MTVHVERCHWALARWALVAMCAAAGFIYLLSWFGPAAAVAG
jgi:hypothetical protein